MRARGLTPDIPPNPAPYITDWLFEIGPTTPTGNGPAAIEWREMTAWQQAMGITLLPWEARAIRRLSRDFVNQMHDARKPDCPAPWIADPEQNREAVSRQLGNAFKALAMAQRKRGGKTLE